MAGDWIKMRMALRTHPKIVRISSALKADRLRTVGALHAVWSVFDEHSVDGILPGYTFKTMDDEIAWPGFSKAMGAPGVEWIEETEHGLKMPRFQEHNGASAKTRATDSQRKRSAREADKSRTESGPTSANCPTNSGTREEKRREEPSTGVDSNSNTDARARNGNGSDRSTSTPRARDFPQRDLTRSTPNSSIERTQAELAAQRAAGEKTSAMPEHVRKFIKPPRRAFEDPPEPEPAAEVTP